MPEIEVTESSHLCARRDSNPQPSDPKSEALSVELRTLGAKDTVNTTAQLANKEQAHRKSRVKTHRYS